MTTLVIPAAGHSTRYGLSRPKFLLQHPTSGTMLSASISGLGNLESHGISDIRVISLKEFFVDISVEKMRSELENFYGVPVIIDLLDSSTSSMVDTLVQSLSKLQYETKLLIKDCDNYVSILPEDTFNIGNFVSYVDLGNYPKVAAFNKSFLSFGLQNELDGIVEKKVVSSYVNVGCVGIQSSSDFLAAALTLSFSKETYVSDVIRVMLSQGFSFKGIEAKQYSDWGTLGEWRDYCNSFGTYFVDLDGVVLENANPLGIKFDWSSVQPIQENVDALLQLAKSKSIQIIFTTARHENYREQVEIGLRNLGFVNFQVLMSLQHAKRYLINDFAQTNPFPSAIAINFPRSARNLHEYL